MIGTDSTHQLLRRKARQVAGPSGVEKESPPTVDRALSRAVARAAQRELDLEMDVRDVTLHETMSLAEVLDIPEERALLVILEGPGGGLGLFAVGYDVMEAILQKQTTGTVQQACESHRHPTRTDAAMSAALLERILGEFEMAMSGRPEPSWWAGYRYASFLAEPRSLGLLLEDTGYRALSFEVGVAAGVRRGRMLLVLPMHAAAPGRAPEVAGRPEGEAAPGAVGEAALSDLVMQSGARFDAVLCRLNLPLGAVMRLRVGDVVALPQAYLDGVALDAPGARALASGRLGQSRGHRAVRLQLPADPQGAGQSTPDTPDVSQGPAPQAAAEPAPAVATEGEPETLRGPAPLPGDGGALAAAADLTLLTEE